MSQEGRLFISHSPAMTTHHKLNRSLGSNLITGPIFAASKTRFSSLPKFSSARLLTLHLRIGH